MACSKLLAQYERRSFRHFALPPQETWEPIPKNSPNISLLRNRLPSFWSRLANIDREREGENSAMGTRPHNRLGCRWACLKLHASSPSLISFYSSTLWEISELLCFSASWSQSHKKLSAWHPGIRVLNTNTVHQIGETLCTCEKICTITHRGNSVVLWTLFFATHHQTNCDIREVFPSYCSPSIINTLH